MKNDNEAIFIMTRKKSLFIYYTLAIIVYLTMLLFGIGSILLESILAKIVGIFLIFFTFYGFFYLFDIKFIACYQDFFVIRRAFFMQKFYYNEFKSYLPNCGVMCSLMLKFKKFKLPLHINQELFSQDEFNSFIEILQNHNIKRYNWFD